MSHFRHGPTVLAESQQHTQEALFAALFPCSCHDSDLALIVLQHCARSRSQRAVDLPQLQASLERFSG